MQPTRASVIGRWWGLGLLALAAVCPPLAAAPLAQCSFVCGDGQCCGSAGETSANCPQDCAGGNTQPPPGSPSAPTAPSPAVNVEIRAVHLTNLRSAVNALRPGCGLLQATWTNPVITPMVTPIRAIHVNELQQALLDIYRSPQYTGVRSPPNLFPVQALQSTIRAADFIDVQNGLNGIACCGDGICNGTETNCTCPGDCPTTVCGDGCCRGSESYCSCPADCTPRCGDGCCTGSESCSSCSSDCGSCCGNGACDNGEDCSSCPGDCGACAPTCANTGGACRVNSDCCTGTCVGGTCQANCTADGGACTLDADCCSNSCVSGACQPAAGSCWPNGMPCTNPSQCCSGSCGNGGSGICGNCGGPWWPCSRNSDCCSNNCINGQCIPNGPPPVPPGCSCGNWGIGQLCGGGGCNPRTQDEQVRTCNPFGCAQDWQCVPDSGCGGCLADGSSCSSNGTPCCSGSCLNGSCATAPTCGGLGATGCASGGVTCCPGLTCNSFFDRCETACIADGSVCSGNGACCSNSCINGTCQAPACSGTGASCGANVQCCSGYCSNGSCACANSCGDGTCCATWNETTANCPQDCPSAPICSCTTWANDACGAGSCLTTEMHQTRTCSPAGCGGVDRCLGNPNPPCPGGVGVCNCSWQNLSCGGGGCAANQMAQQWTCTPANCQPPSIQCLANPNPPCGGVGGCTPTTNTLGCGPPACPVGQQHIQIVHSPAGCLPDVDSCQLDATCPGPCGDAGQACCAGSCNGSLVCTNNICGTPPPCGNFAQICCAGGSCNGNLVCTSGICGSPPCGDAGQACCLGNSCNTGLVCNGTTCTSPPPPPACRGPGLGCGGSFGCCSGLSCCTSCPASHSAGAGETGTCAPTADCASLCCGGGGTSCTSGPECCSPLVCNPYTFSGATCCKDNGASCNGSGECCQACSENRSCVSLCGATAGTNCPPNGSAPCCLGLTCVSGKCQ